MKTMFVACICLSSILLTSASIAQQPEFPGPEPEHELLKKFVGVWETSTECSTGPGTEAVTNHGQITSEMLGGLWVVNRMKIEAEGLVVLGRQTIGYDPGKKKYVGVWTDSMLNHLWIYEGSYDEATKTLTLDTEGPNMMGKGEIIPFRDTYQFVSDDRILSKSMALGEDGEWITFMTGEMRRSTEEK